MSSEFRIREASMRAIFRETDAWAEKNPGVTAQAVLIRLRRRLRQRFGFDLDKEDK